MNKRIFTLSIVAIIAVLGHVYSYAGAPQNYYKSLEGKSGQELKDAIYTLIRPHTIHSYSSLWYYFWETDPMPDNPQQVWDMYSNNQYFFSSTRGNATSGMNKEHSLPKAWWGGSTNKEEYPSYTDLHHLLPSDATANNRKSAWPMGEVYGTPAFNNGVSKTGTPKTGQGGGAGTVFEPDDQYKGDFARIYFYMATCYQDYDWKVTYMLDNNSWKTLNQWSIDMLVRWAREDTVSKKETDRNDAVFRCQNNRNPFVDDPLLFEYIWGNRAGQVYYSSHTGEPNPDPGPDPTGNPQLITPTQGTLLDFGEVALGDSAVLTLYVKGDALNQNLNLQLYRYNYQMFSIPTTSIAFSDACTDEGYPLQVTYKPTSLGDHKAKLLFTGGGMVGSVGVDIKATCVESIATAGDINGDGLTDVVDVSLLIDLILAKTSGFEDLYVNDPDINGDGNVDVTDVSVLIDIILGVVTEVE